MLKTIVNWVLSAVIIMLTAYLVPGITVSGFLSALLVVLAITVVNAFIKPLIKITSLPFNAVVLAIFTLVINALLFMLVGMVVPGFAVDGFVSALIGSIIVSIFIVPLTLFSSKK